MEQVGTDCKEEPVAAEHIFAIKTSKFKKNAEEEKFFSRGLSARQEL